MDNSETIKKNIRTINPIFTDELLNLLYEYLFLRHSSECLISLQDIKEDISLKNKISEVTLQLLRSSSFNISFIVVSILSCAVLIQAR